MKLIPLSGGKAFAQVDDEDYDDLMKYKWHVNKNGKTCYALRAIKDVNRTKISMHVQLMSNEITEGLEVDHKDHNGLNNQRDNLRVGTRQQNGCNTQISVGTLRGIFWNRERQLYFTQVVVYGKVHFSGYFDTPEEAARHYDALAVKYHGEFASINYPGEPLVNLKRSRRKPRPKLNSSKLTAQDVIEIRKLISAGERQKDVAAKFNIDRSTVLRITKNTTWKHIK